MKANIYFVFHAQDFGSLHLLHDCSLTKLICVIKLTQSEIWKVKIYICLKLTKQSVEVTDFRGQLKQIYCILKL